MKKKIIIIAISLLVIIFLGVGFFAYGMSPVSKNDEKVVFEIAPGTNKVKVIENMKKAGLIKNELVMKIYLFFKRDMTIQAGTYEFIKSQTPQSMFDKMRKGEIQINSTKITLVEGKRLTNYIKTISQELNVNENDLLELLANKEFLEECINKYWFITDDILNDQIYYPLEGYLYPDTYEFLNTDSAKQIIFKILDNTNNKLNSIKAEITSSSFNVHELLSFASIVELEALNEDDRKTVSQVIYKRLALNWTLGMDVTAYYALKREMGTGLSKKDLQTINPYNTRDDLSGKMNGKLPIGPICNSSLMSIKSALEPKDGDYLFFYADIKTGKVYFSRTEEEHSKIINEVG